MDTIIMTKNTIPKKSSENLKDLIFDIPLQQRKRMVRNEAYREGCLDSTMFWKIQFHNTIHSQFTYETQFYK